MQKFKVYLYLFMVAFYCQNAVQEKQLFLIHGEPKAQHKPKRRLELKGFSNIIPALHEEFNLNKINWEICERPVNKRAI